MTINQHISMIRGLMRANDTDDTPFTDELVYRLFNMAGTKLNKDRYTKHYKISDWNKSTFCIKLEKAKSHNCACVAVGCDVLKSVFEIPKPIVDKRKDLIKLYDLDWTEIPIIIEHEQVTNQLDPMWVGQTTASIVNRKVMLWNNLDLKAIQVQGLFEDISDWDGKQLCDVEGNESDCYSIDTEDYPLDADLDYAAYQMVFNLLQLPIQLIPDQTNDASEMKN